MTARQPVVIGVGQLSNRAGDPSQVMEPLALMAEVARRAAADAGIGDRLREVDELTVINIISRAYADPRVPRRAPRMTPRQSWYTALGGNSPQWRVNETAGRIARGEVRLALIAGAEAVAGLQMARKAGVKLAWADEGSPATVGENRWGNNETEQHHHAQMPTSVYPLFENALRAHRGWSIERHRAHLGALCARLAAVAKDNPYAWFRDGKTADDHRQRRHRIIGWPYRST
jgi:acetyl-CoA acetyltransferase